MDPITGYIAIAQQLIAMGETVGPPLVAGIKALWAAMHGRQMTDVELNAILDGVKADAATRAAIREAMGGDPQTT